jgi:hypothetical protein
MRICRFNEIEKDFATHIAQKRIVPIIGSGFSVGCRSSHGFVPSGKMMRDYMFEQVVTTMHLDKSTDDYKKLESYKFSDIADAYQQVIPYDLQRKYVAENFIGVQVEDTRKLLLNVDWLYIYTLNIDDSIEKNSDYSYVVHSNRQFIDDGIGKAKYVIKLHGDAFDFTRYSDSKCKVFSTSQYAYSLQANKALLDKLCHDYQFLNLFYIGCSLEDEFDLAAIKQIVDTSFDTDIKDMQTLTSKYVFVMGEPSPLDQLNYSKYGITDIVVFDTYEDMYLCIQQAWRYSQEIDITGLDSCKNLKISRIGKSYEENVPYFFHGKNPFSIKDNVINLPAFFILRDIASHMTKNLQLNTIHILYGSRVCGKTYLLLSLVNLVRDRDVFFFDSRTRLNSEAISVLLNKTNSLIIFDTNSINKDQMEYLVKSREFVHQKGLNIIITINNTDKDIISLLDLLSARGELPQEKILKYHLKSKFSPNEVKRINTILPSLTIGIMDESKTIVDNLIDIERQMVVEGRFARIVPNTNSIYDIVVLILLAVNEKIYTTDIYTFCIAKEVYGQLAKTEPLIDEEYTLLFEVGMSNSSSLKYILNAKYWLHGCLGRLSSDSKNHSKIVDAYKHIISCLIEIGKKRNNSRIRDLILFDVINEIFPSNNKSQLSLICSIYEGLNDLLATDSQYLHQRAKCYWQSSYAFDAKASALLKDALHLSRVARQHFQTNYNQSPNEKIAISIAHVDYTIALIKCRMCEIENYENIDAIQEAIECSLNALDSPHNRDEFYVPSRRDSIKNFFTFLITNEVQDKLDKEHKKMFVNVNRLLHDKSRGAI